MEIGIFINEKITPTKLQEDDNRGLAALLENERFVLCFPASHQETALWTYSRDDGSCILIHHAYARFRHHLGGIKWQEIHCNRFDVISEREGVAQDVLVALMKFYLEKGYSAPYLRVYPGRLS